MMHKMAHVFNVRVFAGNVGVSMAWDEHFDSAAMGRRPGSDFEWYAVDQKGQIAFLTSAGFGPIPKLVFRSKEYYQRAATFFRSLPNRCGYMLVASGNLNYSTWTRVAEQGLYGYDWNAAVGRYVPGHSYAVITHPKVPLMVSDLQSIQTWISPIRFDSEFDTASDLFPEMEFKELNL